MLHAMRWLDRTIGGGVVTILKFESAAGEVQFIIAQPGGGANFLQNPMSNVYLAAVCAKYNK